MTNKFKVGDRVVVKIVPFVDVKAVVTQLPNSSIPYYSIELYGQPPGTEHCCLEEYLDHETVAAGNNSVSWAPYPNYSIPYTSPGVGTYQVSSGTTINVDRYGQLTLCYGSDPKPVGCECGAEKTYGDGTPFHSDWCPKYVKPGRSA